MIENKFFGLLFAHVNISFLFFFFGVVVVAVAVSIQSGFVCACIYIFSTVHIALNTRWTDKRAQNGKRPIHIFFPLSFFPLLFHFISIQTYNCYTSIDSYAYDCNHGLTIVLFLFFFNFLLNKMEKKAQGGEYNTFLFGFVVLCFEFSHGKMGFGVLFVSLFFLSSRSLISAICARLTLLAAAQNKCAWIEDKTFVCCFFFHFSFICCTLYTQCTFVTDFDSYFHNSLCPKRREIKCWGREMEFFICFLKEEKTIE